MDMTTLAKLETNPKSQPFFLYESISCGVDTWSCYLGKGRQIFSFDSRLRSEDSLHRTNYYRTNWPKYPNLDLFLEYDTKMDKLRDQWMKDWGHPARAKRIIIFHGPQVLIIFSGNGFKSWSKAIRGWGYDTYAWHVDDVHCGASI